ncbi:MAG: argininosuccinate synthase [Firmicutes bacterium]|nr:argininosuccinate synthase [Bacillota bacterium]
MKEKVVLAYSGGLDTSVAVHWLSEAKGYDVIALSLDVGQADTDFGAIKERALQAGAVEVVVKDAKEEMAEEYVLPSLLANALYEGKYPLVSALSRPLIVSHLISTAKEFSASAVAHGCTGKGNDQVRFEVGALGLDPYIDVIAPVREWNMTREDSIRYAKEHNLAITASKDRIYSIDENLWGRAIECGILEDPWSEPPVDVFSYTANDGTRLETEVVIAFEEGVPKSVNGREMSLVDLINELNVLAGSCGFGRIDMVESRRVGIKSREVYECPAALALILAHQDLEALTLERDLLHEKLRLEPRFADLVYDGLWFSPLREALSAFMTSTQKYVTGEVKMRFGPGPVGKVTGRRSEVGLYDYNLATYDEADSFNHEDAKGFVRIFGLGIATWAKRQTVPKGK